MLAMSLSSRSSLPRQCEGAQRGQIDLRVDRCRLRAAMAQNLPNIGQGGALAQHLQRQCMPELMRTLPRRINAGPSWSVPDDRHHRYRALEATNRCFCAQKYKSAGAGGGANSQGNGGFFAHVGPEKENTATD